MLIPVALLLAVLTTPALAQIPAMPSSENGRFTFHQTADGMLRLDTRTGQVSVCRESIGDWACRIVPDERTALENEIVRLQNENVTLKRELLARGTPLPGTGKNETTQAPREPMLRMPTDADLDRMMSFLEKMWRRLVETMQNVQRDIQKDAEKKG